MITCLIKVLFAIFVFQVMFRDSADDLELFEEQVTTEISSTRQPVDRASDTQKGSDNEIGETGVKSWSTERMKKDTPASHESLTRASELLRKRPPTLPSILQYNSHSKQG